MSHEACNNLLIIKFGVPGGSTANHTAVYKDIKTGIACGNGEGNSIYHLHKHYISVEPSESVQEISLYMHWQRGLPEDTSLEIEVKGCDKTEYCDANTTLEADGCASDVGEKVASVIIQPDGTWSLECIEKGEDCEDELGYMISIPGDIIDVTVVRETRELAPMDPDDPRFMNLIGTETEVIDGYYIYKNIGTITRPRRGDFIEYRDYTLTEPNVDTYIYETEKRDCYYWSKLNDNGRFAEIAYYPDSFGWMFKAEPIYLGNFKAVPNGNGIFYHHWFGEDFERVFEYNPFAENDEDSDIFYKYTITVKLR